MISKRIIPLFLLKNGRLVKGVNFSHHKDVGNPVSQGMIYDAQGADEIAIVDIAATQSGRLIDTGIIRDMITQCRLPIAVGGGIRNLDDARKCFESGADKIIINSEAVRNPKLIRSLANEFGSQSVLVSVDVRRNPSGTWDIYTHSGSRKEDEPVKTHLSRMVDMGAGEIILTSIDREGCLDGFDIDLYRSVGNLVPVPLIASGGSGSYDHMVDLFRQTGCDACALGMMLFLRDYDIVRIKAYLTGRGIFVRDA